MITQPELLTVQQAAEQTGLSEHTLRYYERVGLLLPVDRAPNGHRRYAPDHLRLLQFLIKLRATGMPVEQMKEYAALIRAGEGNEGERLRLLREHKGRVQADIQTLMDNLAVIEKKIDTYQEKYQCISDDSVPAES
jgi:DNA-binding transcriptional MerR regulator